MCGYNSVGRKIARESGIKSPFIFESYRFGFLVKINGNFGTDKVTVYRYKVTVFCRKVTVFVEKSYRCDESYRFGFLVKIIEIYRYIKKSPFLYIVTVIG